jgi:PAS domain S-box-containing protein
MNKINEIEEKYKFIVNAHGEMMTLINNNYVYELVNDSWCRTFGKLREEIIGKKVSEVWGNERFESEIVKKIDKCLEGNIFKEEDSFIIAGGERRYYEVSYYPFKNAENEITHVIGVTSDITERKKAEISLINSEKELRNLNEEKDKYLSIINSDLEKASKYVSSLLPDELISNMLKIKWKIVPSTHLGGDSFGYHWIDNDHMAIYILDVTGHGVGPALHSVSALNILKYGTLLNTNFRKPHEVLKGLNHLFQMTDHYSLFITMWCLVFNKLTMELSYAGAGHPPLLLFNNKGIPAQILSQNIMIGADEKYNFKSDTIKIEPNSEIYLYSDGAYEAILPNGEFMDIEFLEGFILKNRNKNSDEIDVLYNFLIELNKGETLTDDFTMLKVSFG